MPIPKPKTEEKEDEYISRCISEIASEYDAEGQAYAVCKGEWDKPTEMEKIPIEIVGDNEEKILEYVPDVKSNEMEDTYLARCVPYLYPEYVDEQKAFSLCADKYERIITVSDKRREGLSKIMKGKGKGDIANSIHNKIRMIKLADEPSLEDACWDGYEAIGTKIDENGREVPNCVPIKE